MLSDHVSDCRWINKRLVDLQAAGPVSPKTSPTAGHLRCARSAPLSSRAGAFGEFSSPSSDTPTAGFFESSVRVIRSWVLELLQSWNPSQSSCGYRTITATSPCSFLFSHPRMSSGGPALWWRRCQTTNTSNHIIGEAKERIIQFFSCCQAALSRSPPQSLHGKVPAKQPQISSTTEDTLLHWHLTRPWLPSSYHPVSQRKTHGFHSHVNQIGFMCWFAGKVITTNPWPLKKT